MVSLKAKYAAMSPRQRAMFKAKLRKKLQSRKTKTDAKGKGARDVKTTLNTASKYYYKNKNNPSRASQVLGYAAVSKRKPKSLAKKTAARGKGAWDVKESTNTASKNYGKKRPTSKKSDKEYFAQLKRGSRMPVKAKKAKRVTPKKVKVKVKSSVTKKSTPKKTIVKKKKTYTPTRKIGGLKRKKLYYS